MPFAVFSQTSVRVNWDRVNAFPETLTKWERFIHSSDTVRSSALEVISTKTSIPIEDLKQMRPEYFVNDKQQVSSTYTDRDNACLVRDLELVPNNKRYFRCVSIGLGPILATMLPKYTVEKIP